MEFQNFYLFILLLLFFDNCASESEDLYNTKAATTDLDWTAYPAQNGWEELSNPDVDGKIIRTYQVCNIDSKETSSWVRTPYIPSRGAKRAYIDVEFSMRKCDDLNKECKETFNLYFFEADQDEASSTFPPWRENPYVKIDTIAAGERFDSSDVDRAEGVNHKTWTLGPLTTNGFYIAAHDQGACMSILSLRVYYFYCPPIVDELAAFSRTVTGNDTTSLQEVVGKCIFNASPLTDGPRYYCNSNGVWNVRTGFCHCDPGYEVNSNLTKCNQCIDDHFKNSRGNHPCEKCPNNSFSFSAASKKRTETAFCTCYPGYFRGPEETVHSSCTKPPSAPTKVGFSLNATSVMMSWQPPIDNGGRNDLYYRVSCEKCTANRKADSSGHSNCAPCFRDVTFIPANHNQLRETKCAIENLQPYTPYKFQIFALNGVSSSSGRSPASTALEVETKEAVPSVVGPVQVLSSHVDQVFLSWTPPHYPNGQITVYEVSWFDRSTQFNSPTDNDNQERLMTNSTNATITGLIPGNVYSFRVRAATVAGFGPYGQQSDVRVTSNGASNPDVSSFSATQIGIVAGFLGCFLLLIGVLFFCCKKRKVWLKKMSNDNDSEETIALHSTGELIVQLPLQNGGSNNNTRVYVDYLDPYAAVQEFSCEIDRNQLKIEDNIGQGEFGEVSRGKLFGRSGEVDDVAVKMMKEGSSESSNFLREASTMAQFSHPNIIQLKGVVTKSAPHMIVTEFMENGSLDLFLKKKKDQLSLCQLVKMLEGISSGMRYLKRMKFVHRDLAARNILVDQNLICKVSDFGLSRTLENDPHATYTTHGGKIAIRWTAPECIRLREFTSSSDVWSFGIVMWEVTSYGEKPYWTMTNQKVLETLDEGYRLPAPSGCPVKLHHLMVECWAFEAKMRPTMDDVHRRLGEMLRHPSTLNKIK